MAVEQLRPWTAISMNKIPNKLLLLAMGALIIFASITALMIEQNYEFQVSAVTQWLTFNIKGQPQNSDPPTELETK